MDARRRNRYLEAIGIDVWVPRRGNVTVLPQPVAVADAPAATGPAPRAVAQLAPADPQPVPGDMATRWAALRTEVMGCTRSTVRGHVFKALAALRVELDQPLPTPAPSKETH